MANFVADQQNYLDTPTIRSRANRLHGRVRYLHSLFRAPASGTSPAIGDKIIWGKLPLGARILGHLSRIDFNTGTASCTINLGDQFQAARHLAATSIAAAGTATPSAAVFASTSAADTTIGSAVLTNVKGVGAFGVGDIVTGTGIPTGTYVLSFDKSARTVTLSAAATATGAGVSLTGTGTPYETSDDTSNQANAYASANDDCTLISVVAGAQVANNQVISLQLAYVVD